MPLSLSRLTRAPRRRRLPPTGGRLRRRLTPLAARGSPGPYRPYCALRPPTASGARGTRVSLRHRRARAEVGLDDLRARRDRLEGALGDLDAVVERDDPVRDPLDDVQ